MPRTPKSRVIMARSVARRWLQNRAKPEFRMHIYMTPGSSPNLFRSLPNLMKSHRNGQIRLSGVDSAPDLGVQSHFDYVTVWSSNKVALQSLQEFCESKGLDTSGVW